jgi:transcriptional regulator with XRE-family HTH domain
MPMDGEAEYNKAFRARVAQLRRERGYSRDEMASFLGLKSDTYGRYEGGRRLQALPPHLLEKFAALTGTTVEYLVTGKGNRHRR